MPRKDSQSQSRKRGKDKQKDRYAKFGKFTGKALRNKETLIAKQQEKRLNSVQDQKSV